MDLWAARRATTAPLTGPGYCQFLWIADNQAACFGRGTGAGRSYGLMGATDCGAGPKLVASDEPADPIPALQKRLAETKRPTVAVIVTEEHMRPQPAPRPVDPAVETEIKLLLRQCGFEIMDVAQNDLADWARLMDKNDVNAWPRGLQKVDVVITGEAFSEFAARIGNLVSCSARAEVNLISRKDGKIVLADRVTTRAVDLSENIAGKKALEKAGRAMGIHVLEYFAKAGKPQE